jgi:hypothetical protein
MRADIDQWRFADAIPDAYAAIGTEAEANCHAL